MKRLLLPLLAVFALPTTAYAETIYLLLKDYRYGGGYEIEYVLIPMPSIKQCEEEAVKIKSAFKREKYTDHSHVCVRGK